MVQVPNVLGDVTATPVVGEAHFSLGGQELRLTAVGGDPEHGLFIIFNDPTRKTDTYPAGRFLDTEAVKNGKVLLDFNRAYNPPCALTPYATCPLPPKENQLAVEDGQARNTTIPAPRTRRGGPAASTGRRI